MLNSRATLLLSLLTAAVCRPVVAQDTPAIDSQQLAADVKQLVRRQCLDCHDDFLSVTELVRELELVVPGDTNASALFRRVTATDDETRMPQPPQEALRREEIELLRQWIEAGAPEFPEDVALPSVEASDPALAGVVGAEYVLSQIHDFVDATPRDDRPWLRFFSSNHLVTDGVTRDVLKRHQQALAKAINHLSMQPRIVRPTVVDEGVETVFVVDIRELGWHQQPLTVFRDNKPLGRSRANLYDLFLIEYPYGIVFEGSATFDRLWDIYLGQAGLIRPIPFLRIDWFVSTATQFPLYEDIMQLPRHLAALEQRLGVDPDLNLDSFVAQRAGMVLSGVSRNNRVVEHHPARDGSYWKSFDFATSKGLQNMFIDPLNFHFAGGEMIFTLPNGLQGYLITDNAGNRIVDAPTTIVTDKYASDKVVRNGLACMRCHERGMLRFKDDIRPAIAALAPGGLPGRREILRLYPEQEPMNALLQENEDRFMEAMQQALGETQQIEPLKGVSHTYLDDELSLEEASAELGLESSDGLQHVFRLPQFTRLGLAGLASGGVIRRDGWEDYFDLICRHLGLGQPIAPVDGLTRPDHLADGRSFGLVIRTSKPNNVFSAGDRMSISVENKTGVDLRIELIGTSAAGRVAELTSGVISLRNGATYRYPERGTIEITGQTGKESITVFASPRAFARGQVLRGRNMADRFVHEFYEYQRRDGLGRLTSNPAELIKKTLTIETK